MQILVIAGKQRRSHPVGISHGGHGVAILSHRDNIRRTGSNAEQHRQLLPDGDVHVIAVAVGRDQGLALLLIPEQRAAACVYLPDGVGGQVIVAPGLPNVTVYEYDGVPEKGDRLIAAQLLQCLLVGAEDGGVIVTEPELLSDILGVYQEEYIVDVGVAEQGLSLFGSEPLYGSGVLFPPGLQIGPYCGTINRNIWRHGRTEVYMIVVIRKDTQEPAMRQLAVRLMNQGVRIGRTPGQDADVLTLVGDTWRLDPEGLLALPYVLDVRRITPPYRLAGRAAHPENTVVEVGSARIGAEFCLIAGPCAVESQVQMAGVARRVKAAGAQLLRGGVFKPRTSPYSFQGLGQAGIPLLVDAGQEAGLPVVTEITDPRQLDDLADVDVLQVGARNMQNFPLLQALGQVRKPVLLKRGMSATVTELLQAAEYILAGGNSQVILCERGIRTFETDSRATLDIAAIPVLKRLSHLPVIVDPSHAAGRAELVAPLALAAAAAGADGLMVEVHDRPACALSDGAQALSCDQFDALARQVRQLLPHAYR